MVNRTNRREEPNGNRKRWFSISLEMLPAKASFLLIDASMGSFLPFINLFIVSLGLTASDAGLITGIGSIFSFFSSILWGPLTDYTGRRKLVFIILCIGSIITIFPLPWIAKAVGETESSVICPHNSTNVTSYFQHTKNKCYMSHHLLNSRELFYVLLSMTAVLNLFYSGLFSYIDGAVMNVVTNSKSGATFGTQKMFAPIGFGLGSILSGVAVDHYKPKALSHFTGAYYVFLACTALLIPVGYLLVRQNKVKTKKNNENIAGRRGKDLKLLFRSSDNIVFFLSIFMSGMLLRVYQGFSFLIMHDEMHLSKTMMSYTVVMCMVSEMIVYPFSSKLVKLLHGNIPCIILGVLSYFPRFMLISYAKSAQAMIPIQLLHGLGVSLPWACFMQHANEIFPREVMMTVMMVMTTFHFIVSGTVSSMISGVIYHRYGGPALFRGASIVAAAWGVILILYFGIKYRIRSRSKQLKRNKSSDGELNLSYVS